MNEPAFGKLTRSPRHRARELALQGIYEWRISGKDAAAIEKQIQLEKNLGPYDKVMYGNLLRGVISSHTDVEALLEPCLDRPFKELSPVELSILLLGGFELSQSPDVPYKVILNEAVELAKTFGGTDGHKYINGVLDKLVPKVRAAEFAARKG